MKKHFIIYGIILVSGFAWGQPANETSELAMTNYLAALNHENPGVVKSAIIQVMLIQSYHPATDFCKICKKLDDLTLNGSSKGIRFKAFIAANYIKYPEQYDWINKGDYEDIMKILTIYATRLDDINYGLQKGTKRVVDNISPTK